MAQSSNVSSSVVQDVVTGHVSESPNGHISHLPNGHLPNVNVAQFPDELVPQSSRAPLSVRRLVVSIAEFRNDEDLADGDGILGLLERLRLDNLEKEVRCHLMMKEVEVKIAEKNICIGRLKRNGAVQDGVWVVNVCQCLFEVGMFGNSSRNLLSTAKLVLVFQSDISSFSSVSVEDLISRCSYVVLLWNMKKRGWCPEFECRIQSDTLGIGSSSSNRGMSRCLISGIGIGDAAHIQLKDVRLAREINALCMRLTAIVDERVNFVNELDMLEPKLVPGKMAEFMTEIQDKDIRNLMKLQIIRGEFKLSVRENDIFIEKLKGNMDY
ncbi:hypothetical protein Tco_1428010 [Tanacetum coccineum]